MVFGYTPYPPSRQFGCPNPPVAQQNSLKSPLGAFCVSFFPYVFVTWFQVALFVWKTQKELPDIRKELSFQHSEATCFSGMNWKGANRENECFVLRICLFSHIWGFGHPLQRVQDNLPGEIRFRVFWRQCCRRNRNQDTSLGEICCDDRAVALEQSQ